MSQFNPDNLFWNGDDFAPTGNTLAPSTPLGTRGAVLNLPEATRSAMTQMARGEVTGDINQICQQFAVTFAEFERGITSTTANLPIRENLEAEAGILVPLETPFRNLLPRHVGAGAAAAWRQISALGNMSSQMFFSETGAPAEDASTYVAKSSPYKLLGVVGSVTGFAMATGANFQNQLATEKTNQTLNLMKKEEKALINSSSTATAAPYGDGTTAYGFDGLKNLVTTANGTPSAQVQASVGALTTAFIDGQLKYLTDAGGRDKYILTSGQEILSLVHLAVAANSIIRVQATADGQGVMGFKVTGYVDAITGDMVPVYYSRDVSAGEMYFGCKTLPDGKPAMAVDVLPQVQLPELAPNDQIQGYTAQEIAPAASAPQKYGFIISVFETLKMYSAIHFGKATGLTAV